MSSDAGDGVVEYRVVFTRSARRELEALEVGVVRRILSRVEALATDPRPHGCVKLQGTADLWRIRIGDYRVVYSIDDDARLVDIRIVRHRAMSTGGGGFTPNPTFDRTAGSHSLAAAGSTCAFAA